MGTDRPLTRKYARLELERRFRLSRFPEQLDPSDFHRLHDLFISGTYVRLRRVERPDGGFVIAKLGQKIPDFHLPDDPRVREMTTIYLKENQSQVFDGLPGTRSVKRRYYVIDNRYTFAIDVYESPKTASGLMIAEVEADTLSELNQIGLPIWADCEVTSDPGWSAFCLARGDIPGF